MKTMKKISLMLMAALAMLAVSCDDKNDGGDNGGGDNGGGGSGSGNEEVYTTLGTQQSKDNAGNLLANTYDLGNGNQEYAFKGDVTLDASKKYLLRGWVYITDGSSITIPAGTVIFGDKDTKAALIIERGGKIHATGTADKPIIFTSEQPAGSRKPGDWGGLIICGKAKNNLNEMQIEGGPRTKHGGSDDADNSGELQYVRVEFAGYPFKTDQEINGITFGSVGSGTKIDHLQVSYSNDDSYEWFGGTVDCKYLVAYHGWDDDFDTDNGFSGKVQYALGVRHPKIADQSLSNGFESDNNADAKTVEPYTTTRFCNVTLVGPMAQDGAFFNTSYDVSNPGTAYIDGGGLFPNNGSRLGQYQAGVQVRRNSRLSLQNAVIAGYPVGVIIENDKLAGTQENATNTGSTFKNVFLAGYQDNAADTKFGNKTAQSFGILGSDINKKWQDSRSSDGKTFTEGQKSFSHEYLLAAGRGNQFYATIDDLMLNQPNSLLSNPNYGPKSGSPLLSVAAADGFADSGFAGAFKSDAEADNWMAGWTSFTPQTNVY
ncbi:hypothetical protein [Alistipes indistinctus]|uniref:hypothetical protein n=1 Tax=Alistipes indistinctus TaxID=626932 RepID=UPI003521F8D5